MLTFISREISTSSLQINKHQGCKTQESKMPSMLYCFYNHRCQDEDFQTINLFNYQIYIFLYLVIYISEFNCGQIKFGFSGLQINMSGVVSIEGNLGAGKSTLLSLLNIQAIKEPVDEWEHMGGSNILKNYYQNPKRWAFTFQLNALHSRNILWQKTTLEQPNLLHFSERSPLADRFVFGEIMYRQGNLDSAQYTVYSQICHKLIHDSPLRAIIYLRCEPELCLERIKQRNRQGEEGIPLTYLRKVHQRHEEWLGGLLGIPILTIDTGKYDIYSSKDQKQVKTLISTFINDLSVKNRKQGSKIKQQNAQLKVTA